MAAATIRPASTTNTISTPAPVLKSAVNPPPPEPTATTAKTLRRISHHPTLTPYRRRVYRTLLSIPAGRWTTYAALSKHLDSSARAVGGAMRGNPFAPAVPCHRVLGSGGVIGGYKGAWERDGSCSASASASASAAGDGNGNGETTGVEKRRMLEMEGVAFDAAGRAKGECFGEFWDLGDVSGMDGKKKGMGDGNGEFHA